MIKTLRTQRCVECGRFMDCADKDARCEVTPDSAYSVETVAWTCGPCWRKGAVYGQTWSCPLCYYVIQTEDPRRFDFLAKDVESHQQQHGRAWTTYARLADAAG